MSELLDAGQLADILSASEPMYRIPFSVGTIVFYASMGAHHGMRTRAADEPSGIYAKINNGTGAELTRQCFEELCSFVGLRPSSIADVPANLLVPLLNHWFDGGLTATRKPTDFQFIVHHDLALAFTKQKIVPFSNLKLLDQARNAFQSAHGTAEIIGDFKIHHDLRHTVLRLFTGIDTRRINGDDWSVGIQIRNSLTGRTQTAVDRYLFRWTDHTGQIDTACTIPPFTRRTSATEDEAYAWARHAMDDALAGPGDALSAVEHLVHVDVPRDVSVLLRDIFEHYRIPLALRAPIIDIIVTLDPTEMTMYDIMTAISATANTAGLDATSVSLLMRVAGDLPYTGENRCRACDRLTHAH